MKTLLINKILFKNFQFIFSWLLVVEGLSFLICFFVALKYNEPIYTFLVPGLFAVIIGLILYTTSSRKFIPITDNRRIFLLLTFTWVSGILLGTVPYLIGHVVPSLTDCLFESVSGFTLCGSSVITNIDNLGRSVVLWRSLTHWLGGLAAIMMIVQVFPLLSFFGNKYCSSVINTYDYSLLKFKKIIYQIILIYSVLTLSEILLFWVGGIGFFKSACYSFGTVSTGCFLPEDSGIINYSPFIQYLFIFFMSISGVGFFIFLLFVPGKIINLLTKNEELKLYGIIILSVTLFVTLILYYKCGLNTETSFRNGLFQTVSFLSSSGFSLTNYIAWPKYLTLTLMMLAIAGSCLGSTGGGIKLNRLLVIINNFRHSLSTLYRFSVTPDIKFNNEIIDEKTNLSVLSFVALFGIILLIGIILLMLSGVSPTRSVFFIVTAMSTIGHNINMEEYSATVKVILSLFMLIGRLEIYPLLILLIPSFYGKLSKNGGIKL